MGLLYKFYLQGSMDGKNWSDLENGNMHEGVNNLSKVFKVKLENNNRYKYYRLYYSQGGWKYGSSLCSLRKFYMAIKILVIQKI